MENCNVNRILDRSRHSEVFYKKKVFIEILQNSQENTVSDFLF